MCKAFILFAICCLLSCNNQETGKPSLSASDSFIIQGAILTHNGTYGIKYSDDTISVRRDIAKQLLYLGLERAQKTADSILAERAKEHYRDYTPEIDPHLTFEKYIQYCKTQGLNPVVHIERLSK